MATLARLTRPLRSAAVRTFATHFDPAVCRCGQAVPADTVVTLFRERRIGDISTVIDCPHLRMAPFAERPNCKLNITIKQVALPLLGKYPDVTCLDGGQQAALLEALHTPPPGDLGDLTGDHGKQISLFLKECLEMNLIPDIGAIIDIGGQNTATTKAISTMLGDPHLPSVIVDVNMITPALAPEQPNVKYVITDAHNFFSFEDYTSHTVVNTSGKPTVCLFNNILNVLGAEEGWATLKAAWNRLESGDYLVISGLVPQQLETPGSAPYQEVDGIIEFRRGKRFFKSALAPDFFEHVATNLPKSKVVVEEAFKFPAQDPSGNIRHVQGRRLLTLRKT